MLTILSVSYKSKDLLLRNYEWVKKLNPDTPFQWIVVQNSPESEADLSMDDSRFQMMKGPILTDQEKKSSFYRSIHHAKALNLALSKTDADEILILDPDCYLFMPDWIERVRKHMQEERLVFFGVPYHPKYFTHYRGFPNAICLFIQRRLMQEQNYFTLDFLPDFEGRVFWNTTIWDAIHYHSQTLGQFFRFFDPSTRRFPLNRSDFSFIAKRWLNRLFRSISGFDLQKFFDEKVMYTKVLSCKDTGYRIYERYRTKLRHQIVAIFATDSRSFLVRLFESILPDHYRTFPRNTSYIQKTPSPLFEEFGEHGEQFFWKGQFFAFHLKGVADKLPKEMLAQLKTKLLDKIEGYISNKTIFY